MPQANMIPKVPTAADLTQPSPSSPPVAAQGPTRWLRYVSVLTLLSVLLVIPFLFFSSRTKRSGGRELRYGERLGSDASYEEL